MSMIKAYADQIVEFIDLEKFHEARELIKLVARSSRKKVLSLAKMYIQSTYGKKSDEFINFNREMSTSRIRMTTTSSIKDLDDFDSRSKKHHVQI